MIEDDIPGERKLIDNDDKLSPAMIQDAIRCYNDGYSDGYANGYFKGVLDGLGYELVKKDKK